MKKDNKEKTVIGFAERWVSELGELRYCLRKEDAENMPTQYAIEAELQTVRGETESVCVSSVTSDGELAGRIFRAVVNGTVTPCTLRDVVEDFVTETSFVLQA